MTAKSLRITGWLGVVAIAVLSLVPGELRPQILVSNLLEHFAAYCATSFALAFGYLGHTRVLPIALLLTIYAAILETAQLWVPGRASRIIDFAAGSLGAWAGISLVLLFCAAHFKSNRTNGFE